MKRFILLDPIESYGHIMCCEYSPRPQDLTNLDARKPNWRGRHQYSWTPRTNKFRPTAFYIEDIIYLIFKTSYVSEEVNSTESSSLSVSVPCLMIRAFTGLSWPPPN